MSRDSDNRVDLSRRAFLRGRPAEARSLGPPPPCIAGPDTGIDPCADCPDQPCVASCEPDIIRIHPSDHPLSGRAYLSFTETGCTFCGDCFDRCPAAAAPRPEAPFPVGLAILSRENCIAWEGVVCMSCKLACHYQAIDMDGKGRPAIVDAACTGCGMCVPVCPTQAIFIS